jgi:hypothetical protein
LSIFVFIFYITDSLAARCKGMMHILAAGLGQTADGRRQIWISHGVTLER